MAVKVTYIDIETIIELLDIKTANNIRSGKQQQLKSNLQAETRTR